MASFLRSSLIPVLASLPLVATLPALVHADGGKGVRLAKRKLGNVSAKRLVKKHGISEIRFERTMCLGSCPAFTMTLQRSGRAHFHGRAHAPRSGKHQARVERWRFDLLASLLARGGFFTMDKRYKRPVTCQSSAIVSAKRRGRWHQVVDYGQVGPIMLWAIHQALDRVAAELPWKLPGTSQKRLTPKQQARLAKRLIAALNTKTGATLRRDRFLDGRARRRLTGKRGVPHGMSIMLTTAHHDGARVRIGGCVKKLGKLLNYRRQSFPKQLKRIGLALQTAADGRLCALVLLR
jgi:hypothetical protein